VAAAALLVPIDRRPARRAREGLQLDVSSRAAAFGTDVGLQVRHLVPAELANRARLADLLALHDRTGVPHGLGQRQG
jgi:hypothetical protein